MLASRALTDLRALFKYYTTVLDRVTPSGGFVDGGTSVTLYGTGFHDFNGDVALARVGFGGNESLRQPVNALQPTTLEVTAPAVGGNESIEVMLALSLNGVDFDEGMTPVTYKYYYHSSRLLVPSGGPAVGGTAVTVHGEGFESFDGRATSARCRFGEQVVPVTSLDDAAVACVAPPAIALSDVGDTTTGWPEAGATYSWIDAAGGDTAGAGAVEQLLQVAANEVDFRGDRRFVYYHQVMEKVESEASKESQRAGPPTGGYRVTIVGAGFLGFDANASTILVAFGAAGATASNANELAAEANASAGNMTVTAIEVTDTTVVVIAPEASLDEGEVLDRAEVAVLEPAVPPRRAHDGAQRRRLRRRRHRGRLRVLLLHRPAALPLPRRAAMDRVLDVRRRAARAPAAQHPHHVVLPLPALRPLAQAQVLCEEQDGLQEEHPGGLLDRSDYICVCLAA